MADLTNIAAVRNSSATFTWSNGAASQTVVLSKPDEKFILLAYNTDAVAARIRVAAGAYSGAALGSIYKDLVQNALAEIGPLEGERFKNADGKLTVTITGTDDGVFGGTVTAVKLAVIQLP
jgi:hypothetical protein